MIESSEELLRSALVRLAAPWCAPLDNLELGICLLTQPWTGVGGLRRAQLQSELEQIAADLPLGSIYFQRINRSVAELERRGVLEGKGGGRNRRFTLTPAGFGAFIINLSVLTADPTLDGAEFEFKRELVAAWHLMLQRFRDSARDLKFPDGTVDFFEQVAALTVLDRPVVTEALFVETFDILRLIDRQRTHVQGLRRDASAKLVQARVHADIIGTADLSKLDISDMPPVVRENPILLEALRAYVTSGIPLLAVEAKMARYDSYLGYLDILTTKYSAPLGLVDLGEFRRLLKGA